MKKLLDEAGLLQAVGLAMVGVGLGLMSVPLALIVCGALLLLLATVAEVLGMRRDRS